MDTEHAITLARHVAINPFTYTERVLAEALLAEHDARVAAERERDEARASRDALTRDWAESSRALNARLDAVLRERDALRAALPEYAHHNGSCRYSGMHWTPTMPGGDCTCGLDAALGEPDGH